MPQPKIGNSNAITPDPGIAVALNDKDGAAFDAAVLPASSAWRYSEVIPVQAARELALQVFYAGHASTTAGQARLQVRVSNAATPPAYDATKDWSELTLRDDATGTAAALAGSLGSAWESAAPLRNVLRILGLSMQMPAASGASEKTDPGIVFNDAAWRFVQIRMQETGDTTNRGTVTLKASLSA
jgi:hypothetical protein